MDFGFGLGGSGWGGGDDDRNFGGDEWEATFRLRTLDQEVSALVQERGHLWEQLHGAQEGVRALSCAVETLSQEVRDLRVRARASGGETAAPRDESPVASSPFSGWFGTVGGSAASSLLPSRVGGDIARARAAVQPTPAPSGDQELPLKVQRSPWFASQDSSGSDGDPEEVVDVPESHELERSIWDSCLILGLSMPGAIGRFDTMVMATAWLVNLSFQFLFTVIIWSRFTRSPFDTDLVDGVTKWRAVYGHDSERMNPSTQESLVSGVCSGSNAMAGSQKQAETYSTMREFLPRFLPDSLNGYIRGSLGMPFYDGDQADRTGGVSSGFLLSGQELCLMLIALWTLLIFRELRATYETHSAVWTKARERGVATELMRNAYGHVVLRSITRTRAWMVTMFVTIPRASIALALLYSGSYFIIAASNMEDLILNALSLEFIIHTDELLYSVIAPRGVRMIVEEVQPLRLGQFWNKFRTAFKIITILSIIVYVTLVSEYIMGPVVINMKTAMIAMCGGDIQFVARRYNDGIVRTVDPTELGSDSLTNSYGFCAVLQRTGLAGASLEDWLGRKTDVLTDDHSKCLHGLTSKLVEEAYGTGELRYKGDLLLSEEDLYLTGPCEDKDLAKEERLRLLLQDASGSRFLKTCADAASFCGRPPDAGFSSTLVRLYCPAICGCATAGQFFTGTGEGCPLKCTTAWGQVLQNEQRCTDMTPAALRSDPKWFQYVTSVSAFLEQKGTLATMALARTINSTAMVFGCAAVSRARDQLQDIIAEYKVNNATARAAADEAEELDFCSPSKLKGGFGGAEHRSVRFFCPETCSCPSACSRSSDECTDCPVRCR